MAGFCGLPRCRPARPSRVRKAAAGQSVTNHDQFEIGETLPHEAIDFALDHATALRVASIRPHQGAKRVEVAGERRVEAIAAGDVA